MGRWGVVKKLSTGFGLCLCLRNGSGDVRFLVQHLVRHGGGVILSLVRRCGEDRAIYVVANALKETSV